MQDLCIRVLLLIPFVINTLFILLITEKKNKKQREKSIPHNIPLLSLIPFLVSLIEKSLSLNLKLDREKIIIPEKKRNIHLYFALCSILIFFLKICRCEYLRFIQLVSSLFFFFSDFFMLFFFSDYFCCLYGLFLYSSFLNRRICVI